MNCPIARSSLARPSSAPQSARRSLRGRFKIHIAERAAEIVMWLRREGIVSHRAEMMPHDVAMLVDTVGDFIQRQVRNRRQFPLQVSSSAAFAASSSCGMVVLSSATSVTSAGRARHPWPSWRRRSPLTPHCAGRACSDLRIAARRPFIDRKQGCRQGREPSPFQSGIEGLGLSRIHLMSCMTNFPSSWPGLFPAIHVFAALEQVVDARVKPGHDELSVVCRE